MIRWADTFILNSDWLLASERVKLFAMVAKTKALKLKNPMQCRRSLKIHLKISEAQKRHSFAHLWSVQSNTIVKYPLGFPWETDARKSHHSIHTQRYKDSYITLLQYIVLPCWSHETFENQRTLNSDLRLLDPHSALPGASSKRSRLAQPTNFSLANCVARCS